MTVVNQLESNPLPIQQPEPVKPAADANRTNEMLVKPDKKQNGKTGNIIGGVLIVSLMLLGMVGGVFLVERQQIFQSKASSGWEISETNFEFCGDKECILPSDLVYCPTASGFVLTSGECVAQGSVQVNCSDGISGYIYHCPDLTSGNCNTDKKFIGAYVTGQTVDAVAMASQFECGTTQIEFTSDKQSNIPGSCGVVILRNSKCPK